MSTWVRTDEAGGVHLFTIDEEAIEHVEVVERPRLAPGERWCICCGAEGTETPCALGGCTSPGGCATCADPTCPCCHSELECLDDEPEGEQA